VSDKAFNESAQRLGGGRTSGYPFGSMKASGMPSYDGSFGEPSGGLGLAVYSVRARPVWRGVRGECKPLPKLP